MISRPDGEEALNLAFALHIWRELMFAYKAKATLSALPGKDSRHSQWCEEQALIQAQHDAVPVRDDGGPLNFCSPAEDQARDIFEISSIVVYSYLF